MEIIKNINEKYNLKKYFESDDIKNCKDLLQEISNKNNNDTYTDVKLIKNCDKYNKLQNKQIIYIVIQNFLRIIRMVIKL